ncbi:hypothetical protein [Kitasatospora sp. NPDC059673]
MADILAVQREARGERPVGKSCASRISHPLRRRSDQLTAREAAGQPF